MLAAPPFALFGSLTPQRFISYPTGITQAQYETLKEKIGARSEPLCFPSFLANEGSVDLEYDGKYAILTLNNPHKKNAMTFSRLLAVMSRERMMVDLANRLDELEEWKEGCGLILQGADHTFCSGFDLLASKR